MTTCPRCRSTNVHSDRSHTAAHGLHQGMHIGHYLPIVGAAMAAASVFNALFGTAHYHCGNCKHSF